MRALRLARMAQCVRALQVTAAHAAQNPMPARQLHTSTSNPTAVTLTRSLPWRGNGLQVAPSVQRASAPIFTQVRTVATMLKVQKSDRKRLRQQRRGDVVRIPLYVDAKDLAQRLRITMMQLHKAGSAFFDWWPRASERQMRRDGFNMLRDLTLRYDESRDLCEKLGFIPQYEHLGVEALREYHYAYQNHRRLRRTDKQPLLPVTPDQYEASFQPKQPVVSILGHVDHGKTTLLDRIRGTNVARSEDAGITQDLYAFQAQLPDNLVEEWRTNPALVETASHDAKVSRVTERRPVVSPVAELQDLEHAERNTRSLLVRHEKPEPLDAFTTEELLEIYRQVTFLDTPGHVGFFDMRENAAHYSDVVLLVVSAVEGVDSQTLEALDYVRVFKVPVIVVVTKCDLPEADPDSVIRDLRQRGLDVRLHDDPTAFSQLYPTHLKSGRGRTRLRLFSGPTSRTKKDSIPKIPTHEDYVLPPLGPTDETRICPAVMVSSITGLHIDTLLRSLLRTFMTIKPQCDILAPPLGMVLEAFNDEGGRGRVLRTLLISGQVKPKDHFVSGVFLGKVRDIREVGAPETAAQQNAEAKERACLGTGTRSGRGMLGDRLALALPGRPLDIMGAEGLPQAGDDFRIIPDGALAKAVANVRRLELDYPSQGRFWLAGIRPREWRPPAPGDPDDHGEYLESEEEYRATRRRDRATIPDIVQEKRAAASDNEDDIVDEEDGSEEGEIQHEFESGGEEADIDEFDEFNQAIEGYKQDSKETPSTGRGSSRASVPRSTSSQSSVKSKDGKSEKDIWKTVHPEKENTDALPARTIIVKAGTVGGLRMITDSIEAFNSKVEPGKHIKIAHSNVGKATLEDVSRAGLENTLLPPSDTCPLILFRTAPPSNSIVNAAVKQKVEIQHFTVYDDLLRYIMGEEAHAKLFSKATSLRTKSINESIKALKEEAGGVLVAANTPLRDTLGQYYALDAASRPSVVDIDIDGDGYTDASLGSSIQSASTVSKLARLGHGSSIVESRSSLVEQSSEQETVSTVETHDERPSRRLRERSRGSLFAKLNKPSPIQIPAQTLSEQSAQARIELEKLEPKPWTSELADATKKQVLEENENASLSAVAGTTTSPAPKKLSLFVPIPKLGGSENKLLADWELRQMKAAKVRAQSQHSESPSDTTETTEESLPPVSERKPTVYWSGLRKK